MHRGILDSLVNSLAGSVTMQLRACHCCGMVQSIPKLANGERAACVRCGSRVNDASSDALLVANRCLAAAVGSLALYAPAITLPIIEIEKLGHHHHASLLGGTLDLLASGNWFVGIVVLLFSILLPLVKLVGLIELSWMGMTHRRHRAWTYRLVEWAGRWSMMDVLLLALLVALVKIGDLVEFRIGIGVVAFVMCVIMSMVASILFDPHSIWDESEPTQ